MQISATPKTPLVQFDFEAKFLLLKGVSCPDNPLQFFTPIFENLKEYLKSNTELSIEMQLDYFNTGSSKCILNLFQMITDALEDKQNIKVKWLTDEGDSELREAGKIFQEMSGLDFTFLNNEEL
ncbi:MAG: DUF1987 domain-containing protein [Flavobacteriia bacterium]|jgi:hypothetical protein